MPQSRQSVPAATLMSAPQIDINSGTGLGAVTDCGFGLVVSYLWFRTCGFGLVGGRGWTELAKEAPGVHSFLAPTLVLTHIFAS